MTYTVMGAGHSPSKLAFDVADISSKVWVSHPASTRPYDVSAPIFFFSFLMYESVKLSAKISLFESSDLLKAFFLLCNKTFSSLTVSSTLDPVIVWLNLRASTWLARLDALGDKCAKKGLLELECRLNPAPSTLLLRQEIGMLTFYRCYSTLSSTWLLMQVLNGFICPLK